MPTILTVAGKADSRAIVYPMLYILKNYGRVMVITDDAAYRRLYHGYEDVGEVSGIGVYVNARMDTRVLLDEIDAFAPDYIVCVTNGYVPEYTSHLLVLTGYDRSFAGGNAHSKDELEKGIQMHLEESDLVVAPKGLGTERIREVIVSSTPVKGAKTIAICLKEGLLLHAAKCEEYKAILPPESRDFVSILAKILNPFVLSAPELEMVRICGFKK